MKFSNYLAIIADLLVHSEIESWFRRRTTVARRDKTLPKSKTRPKIQKLPELFISQTFTFSRVQANATLSAIVGRLHVAFTYQINLSSHLSFFRTRLKSELNHLYITIVVSRLFKKRSPVFVASLNSNVQGPRSSQ